MIGFPYTHQQPNSFGDPRGAQSDAYALQAVALAFTNALATVASKLVPPQINPQFPTIATAPVPLTAPLPVLKDVNWLVPTQPGALTATLDISGLTPPPFSVAPPVLSFGTAPLPDYGSAPDAPAVNLNYTLPTLTLNLPSVPQLMSLSTVNFDPVTLPTFTAQQPVLTAVAPNIAPYQEGALYTSALLDQTKADLLKAVQEGTWTGLPAAAEQALWDRAREREYRQMADALADLDRMDAFGFSLPPGVYLDARIKLQTEMQNTTAGLSREIMIKQAELTLENITKAREHAVMLEGKLIDYNNQVAQRAFESAKFLAESKISLYNASVQAYTAQQEGYKAAAMVYDYQIKGALALAEIYRTRIEGEKVKAEVNQTLVSMYKTQVDAQLANVEVYKAQLGALETQANIEKLKIEVYGEEIKGFVGRINAFTAEVEAYKAGVQTQGVIEQTYKTQVEAYTAQVNADVALITSRVEAYKGQIAGYTAQLEGYKASLQGMTEQARAAALYNTAAAEVYKAEISGLSSYNATLTQQWHAVADIAEKEAEVSIKAAEAQGQMYIATKGLAVEAAKTAASVAGQLGAAAINAVHYSNAVSWSSSGQQSYQASDNNSVSQSDNRNQNENTNI